MNTYIYYENGNLREILRLPSGEQAISRIATVYKAAGLDWEKDIGIRMFKEDVKDTPDGYDILITLLSKKGKELDRNADGAKIWQIELSYKTLSIRGLIVDRTDMTIYVLWESIQRVLKINLKAALKDLKYTVTLIKGEPTSKSKFITFFSRPENCAKLWKYPDLVTTMEREGLKLVGRGIEGERARECRYAVGYSWLTSEQDKKVPDGHCMVASPFPFDLRNERRAVTCGLEKEDWSELMGILDKNTKRLRCIVCGLFEGETNKIGQKTTFQKGHAKTHLGGGTASNKNIVAICRYCNSEQKNVYDINPVTGKKKYLIVPFIKNRASYEEKLRAFKYLKGHLKKKDVD